MRILLFFVILILYIFYNFEKAHPENKRLGISYNIKKINLLNNHDGCITVQITGSKKPYTHQWSNGNTNKKRTYVPEGTYHLNVFDSNNPFIKKTITISRTIPPPNFDIKTSLHYMNQLTTLLQADVCIICLENSSPGMGNPSPQGADYPPVL